MHHYTSHPIIVLLFITFLSSLLPASTAFPTTHPTTSEETKRRISAPWRFASSGRKASSHTHPYPQSNPDHTHLQWGSNPLDAHSEDTGDANGENVVFPGYRHHQHIRNYSEGSLIGRDATVIESSDIMLMEDSGIITRAFVEGSLSDFLQGDDVKFDVRGPFAVFRPKTRQWFIESHECESHPRPDEERHDSE